MEEQHSMIELQGIIKRFYIGQPNELEILHGIDLKVNRGEFVSIVGSSGSGKTTMMNIIGILDRPTEGEYMLDGVDVAHAKDRDLSMIRNKKIGFVFQTYNLISRTSALKNVELPMLYAGIGKKERTERAKELLNMVGMGERMSHTPDELSGGQKQRVAIARAMANEPSIILADEPTGALDSKTGRMIMDIFHRLNEEQGKTIVLITHSQELAEETQRIVTLKDGIIAFSSDHVGYYHRHRIGHCHHDTGRFHQQFRYRLYGIHGCQQHYRRCISEKYVTGDDIQRNDLFYGPQIHEDDRG